jgi:hypothetical protein
VHLLHPVPEAVEDHPPHERLVGVEGVAGAGVVGVARGVILQDVVGRVVDAAQAERRPLVVTLRGVVEHHVEDHLEPGRVQRSNHPPKLVDLAP